MSGIEYLYENLWPLEVGNLEIIVLSFICHFVLSFYGGLDLSFFVTWLTL